MDYKSTLPRIDNKFMTRSLSGSNQTYLSLKQVCVKRIFLKNLIEKNFKASSPEIIYQSFKNKKIWKILKTASLSSVSRASTIETLKHSKTIKKFQVNSNIGSANPELNQLLPFLKRLSSRVQFLLMNVEPSPRISYEIARNISRFPKLRYLSRDCRHMLGADRKGSHVTEDLRLYNQTASRLGHMKRLNYIVGSNELLGLQEGMGQGLIYKNIQGLEISLMPQEFNGYPQFIQLVGPEEMDDKLDLELWEIWERKFGIRMELEVLFRFEVFPNLQRLCLCQKDFLYPLDSFIVNGFQKLKKLEELEIQIKKRSIGTLYFFKALIELPLLKKFALEINFLRNVDWAFLIKFIRIQYKLQLLSLSVSQQPEDKSHYLQQNIYLEQAVKSLEDTENLESLYLKSSFWSLEALSKGLSYLKIQNKLHTLKIQAADDTITSETNPAKRVEGLCSFLKNQQLSLRRLIFFPIAFDDDVVNEVSQEISKLSNLKRLYLSFHCGFLQESNKLLEFFERTLQKDVPKDQKKLTSTKIWNPNIAPALKGLENLEAFQIKIGVSYLHIANQKWFMNILNDLSSLKHLKSVWVGIDIGGMIEDYQDKVGSALLELKNIQDVDVRLLDTASYKMLNSDLSRLQKVLNSIKKKRITRCDLMF